MRLYILAERLAASSEMSKKATIGVRVMVLIPIIAVCIALFALSVYILILLIKALRRYLRSSEVRTEKALVRKTLGETLKEYRLKCGMTQEFVAEAIGVSRQAVSKWETESSDPSTSNLLALAKLYGISAEKLLKNVSEEGSQKSES